MTLLNLIRESKGIYVLYWYDGDELASKACKPEIIDENTIKLCPEEVENMAKQNLYCLAFEEVGADHIYVFNKGYVENSDGVYLRSDDFTVSPNDKRVFYRYDISTTIMVVGVNGQYKATLNNISYSGMSLSTDCKMELGEDVLVYDPDEKNPVYIPCTVVYRDEGRNYGLRITGEYEHINKIVSPNLTEYGTLSW